MSKVQIPDILEETVTVTAKLGTEGVSIRTIAKQLKIPPSLICYHFHTKTDLLNAMSSYASDQLSIERKKLSLQAPLPDLLEQRIAFQFEYARYIVAILKFYMGNRDQFPKQSDGFLPPAAYKHIEEILEQAIKNNEVKKIDVRTTAKIITHTINGYVLEYFPYQLPKQESEKLSNSLAQAFVEMIH